MNSKNIFSPVVGWTLIDTIERFLKIRFLGKISHRL